MICTICKGHCTSMGVVPFDKNNCNIPVVNDTPMEYYRCDSCEFIFCPEMLAWTPKQMGANVYNSEYVKYDPDYTGFRAVNYANMLLSNVHYTNSARIKHLDYGSGEGGLSNHLRKHKWNSTSYDPYSSPTKPTELFNFITAIEVVEHALDIDATIKDMKQYLTKDGVILISTLLGDENTKLSWKYVLPRCGHIGIVSDKSMKTLCKNNDLFFKTVSVNLHTLQPARSNAKNVLGWLNG